MYDPLNRPEVWRPAIDSAAESAEYWEMDEHIVGFGLFTKYRITLATIPSEKVTLNLLCLITLVLSQVSTEILKFEYYNFNF